MIIDNVIIQIACEQTPLFRTLISYVKRVRNCKVVGGRLPHKPDYYLYAYVPDEALYDFCFALFEILVRCRAYFFISGKSNKQVADTLDLIKTTDHRAILMLQQKAKEDEQREQELEQDNN